MGRIFEAIMRFMLNQRLLQRFEEKVPKGKTATIDVFLEKGKEYVVRGEVLKGRGTPILSLGSFTGFVVPTYYGGKRRCFYFTPERDGLYRIWVAIKPAVEGREREPAIVSVTLSCANPIPEHIINLIKTLPCESETGPGSENTNLRKGCPKQRQPSKGKECKGSSTMIYDDEIPEKNKAAG